MLNGNLNYLHIQNELFGPYWKRSPLHATKEYLIQKRRFSGLKFYRKSLKSLPPAFKDGFIIEFL